MSFDWKPQPTDRGLTRRLWAIIRRLALTTLGLLVILLAGCQAGKTSVPAPPGATLALLGDVMLGRGIHPSAGTFSYLEPFLKDADLALANLESPLTIAPAQTTSTYVLCAPPGNVKYLAEAGIDLLSLANNHHLDCGEKGLDKTQSTLATAGLGFVGPGPEPIYRTINRIPLAFLAFDAIGEFSLETAAQAVRSARETGAIVVVSIHWGMEYQSGASENQKTIASQIAKAGAALIWGHHPHVLQPAEWINNGSTLVLYSLGNALFDQYNLESTRQSALVLVKLGRDGVEELRAVPFVIDISNNRIAEPDQATKETIMNYFKIRSEP
jgi:poly-gamma-glutamate synthesis protein (capsule biosynthesis protein)